MRKIYFVRHGESEHNAAGIYAGTIDSPLTSTGIFQAKETGCLLTSKDISHIITSELKRAQHTAQEIKHIILQHSKTPIETTPYLNEVYFGDIQNKKIQQIDGLIYGVESNTGETLNALYSRAYKVINLLLNSPGTSPILVVGHGAFSAVIFAINEGVPKDKFIAYKRTWSFNNGEIKEISFQDFNPKVLL